jgi:hypothetical protein
MKIEIYYYELQEAIREAINKRLKAELDFEDFEGDIHMVVETTTFSNGNPPETEHTDFGECDSFIIYLD